MQGLIQQTCTNLDDVSRRVKEGWYDLVGPDGEIILPAVWEDTIQPGWEIKMNLWPVGGDAIVLAGDRAPGLSGALGVPRTLTSGTAQSYYPVAEPATSPTKTDKGNLFSWITGKRPRNDYDYDDDIRTTSPRYYYRDDVVRPSYGAEAPGSMRDHGRETDDQKGLDLSWDVARNPGKSRVEGPSAAYDNDSGAEIHVNTYGPRHYKRSETMKFELLTVIPRARPLHGPQPPFRPPLRRQTIKTLDKVICEPWKMQIKSARVYPNELATTGSVSLELVGSVKPPGPASTIGAMGHLQGNQNHTTWL